MKWLKGPNGNVVGVPERSAKSIVGDGKRGYKSAAAPRERASNTSDDK